MKTTAFAATVALTLPMLAAAPAFAEKVSTEKFVNKAAVSGMFEVQSGELAADKAENEDVKAFGEEIAEDHSEANDELKELVKDEEIKAELPASLDKKHQSNLDKLKNLSGAKFDQTFIPMQVLAHEQAVNLFQDYSQSGDNEALKEWASDTLPTLKEHLDEARALNKELSKPAETAAADDADTANVDDKAMAEKATDEADVDGETNAKDKRTADRKTTPPPFDYVTRQAPTDWTAEALIGRTVKNEGGETLGEINNVIINEKGRAVAITIGVGGVLGLGEKDVGVPFQALKFRSEQAIENQAEANSEDNTQAEDTAAADNNESMDEADASHSDMVVVIDATKEQLEAAPDFVWLGEEESEKRAETDTDTSVE